MMAYVGLAALLLVLVLVAPAVALSAAAAWGDRRTTGSAYYCASGEERRRFKRMLALQRSVLRPAIWLLGRTTTFRLADAGIEHGGVRGPKGTCTEESLRAGLAFEPGAGDVVIATQLRSGTTLTQHLVFQVLTRGRGDLVAEDRMLQAVSPWIEAARSVRVSEGPHVGEECPTRILKTHFAAEDCPFDADARYVVVVRHPASCFASCVDYLRTNLGPFAPDTAAIETWFCDDAAMWWGAWPRHVAGWWSRAATHGNVLALRFEDICADVRGTATVLASHLGLAPLSAREIDAIERKCAFDYMREHFEHFEMTPPHLFQDGRALFKSGRIDRHQDVAEATRERIRAWAAEGLAEQGVVPESIYSDLGSPISPGGAQR